MKVGLFEIFENSQKKICRSVAENAIKEIHSLEIELDPLDPQGSKNRPPKRLHHKNLTTGSLELKFHIYNLEGARNPKMLSLIG